MTFWARSWKRYFSRVDLLYVTFAICHSNSSNILFYLQAVVLHLQKSKVNLNVKKGVLPELSHGDQLEIDDIKRAVTETSLKSLYSSSDAGKMSQIAQLYFGHGFEDRLELELEE